MIIDMYNIKSKINDFNTLPFEIQNDICLKCSYIKIGFGIPKDRHYLINPQNGIVYTGLLPYILPILKKNNIIYQINDHRIKPLKRFNWAITNGFKLRDYQQRIVQSAVTKKRAVFQSCTSSGKAIDVHTDILTPNGWVKMKDIHIGSIVYDENGKETKVIGEYPQGLKDVYEVTFKDGSKIKCCKDHLWKYTTSDVYKTATTQELLNSGVKFNRQYKFAVPINKPIQFEKKDLLIKPYILGVLIGCGHFGINIELTNHEEDIITKISKDYKLNNYKFEKSSDVYNYIRKIYSYRFTNKFIPQDYLYSSVNDRFELIQGLIDSKGYINHHGYIIFRTQCKQLGNDFAFLIRSLGYRVTLQTVSNNGNIIYVYTILSNDNKLISSNKHKEKLKNVEVRKQDKLKIINIKKLNEKVEMKCISVDSPEHTYICENFIVTHNTFMMTNMIIEFGVLTLVVAPKASLSVQLRNELQEFLGIKIGLINGNEVDYYNGNKVCPIIVGTPQTLLKYPEILNKVEAVFCDECHNVPANLIFQLVSSTKNAYYRVAVSATPWRDDGTDLLIDAVFAPRNPKDTITASELINKNVLTPIDINIYHCNSQCDWLGSYNDTYLTGIVHNSTRNAMVIDLAKKHFNLNHPTVILISRQEHGHLLLNLLKQEIINKSYNIIYKNKNYQIHTIEFVSGEDDINFREAIFKSVREGKTKIIVASTILDEGLDIKNLQCLIMAQGGCSSTRLFQRVGRVIRAYPGKDKAYVYDFIDSNPTLYSHSMTRIELMKMEPAWNINIH